MLIVQVKQPFLATYAYPDEVKQHHLHLLRRQLVGYSLREWTRIQLFQKLDRLVLSDSTLYFLLKHFDDDLLFMLETLDSSKKNKQNHRLVESMTISDVVLRQKSKTEATIQGLDLNKKFANIQKEKYLNIIGILESILASDGEEYPLWSAYKKGGDVDSAIRQLLQREIDRRIKVKWGDWLITTIANKVVGKRPEIAAQMPVELLTSGRQAYKNIQYQLNSFIDGFFDNYLIHPVIITRKLSSIFQLDFFKRVERKCLALLDFYCEFNQHKVMQLFLDIDYDDRVIKEFLLELNNFIVNIKKAKGKLATFEMVDITGLFAIDRMKKFLGSSVVKTRTSTGAIAASSSSSSSRGHSYSVSDKANDIESELSGNDDKKESKFDDIGLYVPDKDANSVFTGSLSAGMQLFGIWNDPTDIDKDKFVKQLKENDSILEEIIVVP